jgi:[ribosomal protein S5]-alanine N-acetyltransferase
MKPPETIQTSRLTLRRLAMEDADDIFAAYAQDVQVTRFLTWRPHQRIEETRSFVRKTILAWDAGTEFTWAIFRSAGELIGGIALRRQGFKVDFGYVIARTHWGNGLAAEALQPLVDWAMAQPEVFRAWAVCDAENAASARVMEKVGMTREGILRRWMLHPQAGDAPRDCICYSIVKE